MNLYLIFQDVIIIIHQKNIDYDRLVLLELAFGISIENGFIEHISAIALNILIVNTIVL